MKLWILDVLLIAMDKGLLEILVVLSQLHLDQLTKPPKELIQQQLGQLILLPKGLIQPPKELIQQHLEQLIQLPKRPTLQLREQHLHHFVILGVNFIQYKYI
jgi:hypothetical protein